MKRNSKFKSGTSFKKPYFKSDGLSPRRLKALRHDTSKKLRNLNSDFEIPVGKLYKKLVKSCWYIRHAASIHEYLGGKPVKK